MSQSIPELAKALRDAASAIENAAKFSLKEEIDLPEVVAILRTCKKKNEDIKLVLQVEIDDKGESIEYRIDEGWNNKAKSGSMQNCLEIFLATKEGSENLASLARLVKSAVKAEEKEQAALAVVN